MSVTKQLAEAILKDQRSVKQVLRDAGLPGNGCSYRLLTGLGNPLLSTVEKLAEAVGMEIVLSPIKRSQ